MFDLSNDELTEIRDIDYIINSKDDCYILEGWDGQQSYTPIKYEELVEKLKVRDIYI